MNTQGTVRAQSSYPAQVRSYTCGTEYTLLEEMLKLDNMMVALKRVEQNKGAAGVDKVDVKSLRPYLKEHWFRIREELLEGTYKPQPVRRVEIPKSDGGIRLLGIPTLVDRLIQQGLAQVLTPIFEPSFSNSSYGFRPNRSTHQAVKQAKQYIEEGYRYVVDLDLEKFFDRVNHDILMARVARKVQDKRTLGLIRAYLNAGVMANGVCVRSEQGVPQGAPLSPILSNIILDDLDKELERRGHLFVRYADDCNIYVKTARAGQRVMEGVKRFVEDVLKLKVNEQKSAVDRPWKRKFLGFSFTPERKTRTRIAPKARAKFEDKVRELTRRSRSMSMEKRVDQLNVYLRGWMGYRHPKRYWIARPVDSPTPPHVLFKAVEETPNSLPQSRQARLKPRLRPTAQWLGKRILAFSQHASGEQSPRSSLLGQPRALEFGSVIRQAP